MATAKLYNATGENTGTIDLNDAVFALAPNESLVHQVYVAQRANARQPWAHAKDRSDVSGGGRKPWKQKGTGRARHGSIRSPIWCGGGATFGPLKTRNFKQKINKKVKAQAVKMCLTDKVTDEKFAVVESLSADGKTKALSALRGKLPGLHKTTLLVTAKKDEKVMKAADNMPKTDVMRAEDVSVVDLMHHQYIIATKDAVSVLEKRLA